MFTSPCGGEYAFKITVLNEIGQRILEAFADTYDEAASHEAAAECAGFTAIVREADDAGIAAVEAFAGDALPF